MLRIMPLFLFLESVVHETDSLHHYYSTYPWVYFEGANVSLLLILPIAGFLALCIILSEITINKRNIAKLISDNLKSIASWVLFFGFILYFIGYSHQINGVSLLMIIGSTIQAGCRALVSSLGMFVFDTDFIEVGEAYHHNIWYLIAFALVHLLGVLVTTHFVLCLLGERFLSNRRMSHILNVTGKRDIFVFWGINEESITLARSIKEKYLKVEKDLGLLFVETPSEKELEIKERSLSHFFNSSLHGSSEKDRIKDLDGIILYPKRRLVDIDIEISESRETHAHFKKLGLSHLAKLCNKSDNVKFFFFSDNQKKNIKDTLILREYFMSCEESNKIELYLRARRNEVGMVLEEQNYLKGNRIKVCLVDDSSLSILSLKMNPQYHPVRYVSVNEKAQVTSELNALILGFGQTGRDAFRFLYEFGSFPGEEKNKHEERSPLHITAVDKNMHEMEAAFISKYPALFQDHNKDRIELSSCDIKSKDFLEEILLCDNKNEIKLKRNLNYIVVALGDDKTNLSMAMDIYRIIMRYKQQDGHKFTIFVRIYERDVTREARLIQECIKCDEENRIEFFGNPEELYTYDLIINDKVLMEAQIFAYIYNKGTKTLKTWNDENKNEAKSAWEKKISSVTRNNILDTKRKIEQDMSNSWHVQTKLYLIKKAGIMDEIRDSWPEKRGAEQKNNEDGIYMSPVKYDVSDSEQKIIDNIAICEHLRWNALSELQGYIPYFDPINEDNHKDHIKKELACLRPWVKPWEGMEDKDTMYYGAQALRDTMQYDYNALDTSIYMNKNNM